MRLNRDCANQNYVDKFGLAIDKCNLHVLDILDCDIERLNIVNGINEGYRKWFVEKFN